MTYVRLLAFCSSAPSREVVVPKSRVKVHLNPEELILGFPVMISVYGSLKGLGIWGQRRVCFRV